MAIPATVVQNQQPKHQKLPLLKQAISGITYLPQTTRLKSQKKQLHHQLTEIHSR